MERSTRSELASEAGKEQCKHADPDYTSLKSKLLEEDYIHRSGDHEGVVGAAAGGGLVVLEDFEGTRTRQ